VVANGEVLLETKLTERRALHCALSRRTIEAGETLLVKLLHPDAQISASAAHPLNDEAVSTMLHGVSLIAARARAAQGFPVDSVAADARHLAFGGRSG